MHLRYIVPPVIVALAGLAIYLPMRRHAIAIRECPSEIHRPIHHLTAAGVVAAALVVAFIAAFILP